MNEGVLPEPDSVRVEEFINYFDYDYDAPRSGLEISIDGGPSPFDEATASGSKNHDDEPISTEFFNKLG